MKLPQILPIKFNIPVIPFRSGTIITAPQVRPNKDGFATIPLYEDFGSKTEIEASARSNPRILELLGKHSLPVKANVEELEKLKNGHLKDTRILTAKIYSALPPELKAEVDIAKLQKAGMFHDYGKVLIPTEILNKKGKLNEKEKVIMELHPELGYELLKTKGFDERTLKLIKYHHQNLQGAGYPEPDKDFEYSIETEILSMADKYTALREERCYKNALSKYEALEILAKEVNAGNLSQEVYNALIKAL